MPRGRSACEKCGDTGKIRYSFLGDVAPRPFGSDGTTIQYMGGSGTRACSCVRDLPAIDGKATWWETESIYSEVVQVPIGCECITVEADCEVPRDENGRRVHRTGDNVYYPALIRMEAPVSSTLHSDSARELAAALIAAADECDKRDGAAFSSIEDGSDAAL
jgi:hypothetical protein